MKDLLCDVLDDATAESSHCLLVVRPLLVLGTHRPGQTRLDVDVVAQQRLVDCVGQRVQLDAVVVVWNEGKDSMKDSLL